MTHRDLVSAALTTPEALLSWKLPTLDLLIRQCRRANLLPRLAVVLADRGLLERVPPQARAHLLAAAHTPQRQDKAVRWETRQILAALAATGTNLVLLKGAAYVMAGMAAARGRVFADIDLLVPRAALPEVEAALMMHGWMTTHHNAYDQRYYRRWMHELPPMRHVTRQSVLDVHHAILPQTARLKPETDKLLAAAVAVPGIANLYVLAPEDMVLHSATHLFHDGELDNGLRDLTDLDALLRECSSQTGFWLRLPARAAELDLLRPLFYALRYTRRILGTPVPATEELQMQGKPPRLLLALMDAIFLRALRPDHPSAADAWTPAARKLLYLRSHWLRMPPLLLALHLAHKALRREEDET
ncbi:hypothetical protein GALL_107490 [mine drainage metagenome]|uniref:Nucleotidyltransferase family protein n=1 Tax=mine drainage metagenome TaxID=410659 RepID=A0A1J5ST16_9ZZZZ